MSNRRRLRRTRPDARIVVTGCAAQIAPERYAAMAEVNAVLGNAEKLDAASFRRLGIYVSGAAGYAVAERNRVRASADVAKSVDAADFNRSARGETRGVEPLKVGES